MSLLNPDAPRKPVVEQCLAKEFTVIDSGGKSVSVQRDDCRKVFTKDDGCQVCEAYLDPERKWVFGCALASNKINPEEAVKKKKLNPIKASKRR